ncbi:MAG: EAL domain-containing protein [Burkholderiales bacterium]
MDRTTTYLLAAAAAFVAALVPVLSALHLSWSAAVNAERDRVATLASRAAARSDAIAGESLEVLAALDGSAVPRCGAEHLAALRDKALAARAVRRIDYVAEGQILCSSWGPGTYEAVSPPDVAVADGVRLWHSGTLSSGRGGRSLAVARGPHRALLDAEAIIDALNDSADTTLAIAAMPSGTLLAKTGLVNDAEVGAALVAKSAGGKAFFAAQASSPRLSLKAVAVSSGERMWRGWAKEALVLGPIGLAAGASLASLVLWLSRRRFSPGVELRRAVRNREFVLLYQPLVELATGACVGAEALVRWRRADGRIVPPLDFIPLAESNGLIRPITEQVIERALTELGPMLRRRRDLHVSINLAPMDLQDPWIAQCLD